MKTKIVIALVAIVGTFGLIGCKPKTTTLKPDQTNQTILEPTQNLPEQTNLKSVVGALGWNLGDVLPNTFQVATNDDKYGPGITYNFDPPTEIGTYPLSSCFLILTEDRKIAAICADGPENDHFNVDDLKKVLEEKYGLGHPAAVKSENISNYFFGQGNRQVNLWTMTVKDSSTQISLKYKDKQLCELAEKQHESRMSAVKNQIQSDLKGQF